MVFYDIMVVLDNNHGYILPEGAENCKSIGQEIREKDRQIENSMTLTRKKEPCPDVLVSKRPLPDVRFIEKCRRKQGGACGDLSGSEIDPLS
jgi:hypothetical protein